MFFEQYCNSSNRTSNELFISIVISLKQLQCSYSIHLFNSYVIIGRFNIHYTIPWSYLRCFCLWKDKICFMKRFRQECHGNRFVIIFICFTKTWCTVLCMRSRLIWTNYSKYLWNITRQLNWKVWVTLESWPTQPLTCLYSQHERVELTCILYFIQH